ncbi:MAG TPA: HEAT repeat domain-containing protein [Gemmatimonadaceae bacterium]|nr:HEAT repeat domain-containing protein [Gemmatimonadaceae bacterium]
MEAYLAPIAAELAVKGAIWLIAIFIMTSAMRRTSAAARHLVWSLGVLGLFALPLLSTRLPWRIAVPLAVAPNAPRAQQLDNSGGAPPTIKTDATEAVAPSAPTQDALGAPSSASVSDPLPGSPSRIPTYVLIGWSAGVLLLLVRLARSIVSVNRIIARAGPCDDEALVAQVYTLGKRIGVKQPVELLEADNITIPFTAGILRPVIVLPNVTRDWSAEKQEAVLLHELAHVARRDLWTSLAAHVACAVHWFNPLVWVAARRLRIEGEKACDDAVLRFGTRASDYADQLLQVVRDTKIRWAPTVAVAMARKSAFEGRLLAILSPETNRGRLTMRIATPVAVGVSLIALTIAAMRPGAAVAQESLSTANAADSLAVQDTLKSAASTTAPARDVQDTAPRGAVLRGLVSALKDDDEGVRLAAVEAISSRRERSVVPDLIAVLDDPAVPVRRAVAQALSQMPDPRAIAALLQALRTDTDAEVRALAAEALGNIDDASAAPGLTAALRQERVPQVRRKIVWALAEIESPSAAASLAEALRDDDAEVRAYAIYGLGNIHAKSSAPQIIPLLRDSNSDVRSKAAWALGEMKIIDALDELMAALNDRDADVRQQIVNALSSMEDQRAVPALVRAIGDDNVDVRREAVNALGNIDGLQHAPRELVAVLSDADAQVRESALQALAHIKDPATASAVIPLTRSGQPLAVRGAAIEALTEIGGSQVEAVLLELMKDSDPKIRRLAAQGLGRDG